MFAKHGLRETFHGTEVPSVLDVVATLFFYAKQPVRYVSLCVCTFVLMHACIHVHKQTYSRCVVHHHCLPLFPVLRSCESPP